jgi:hypothetical protein
MKKGNSTSACSRALDIVFMENIFTQQENSGFIYHYKRKWPNTFHLEL